MIFGYVINISAVQAGTPLTVKCLEKGQLGLPLFLDIPQDKLDASSKHFYKYPGVWGRAPRRQCRD